MPCELEFHEMSTFFRHCSFLWSTSYNLMITWNNYLLVVLCPPTILISTSLPFKSWFDTIVSILLLPVSLNQLIFSSLFVHSKCGISLLWYFSHFFYTIGTYLVVVMDREAWCAEIHGVTKSWTWLSDWTELNWGALREKPVFLFIFFLQRALHVLDAQWQ